MNLKAKGYFTAEAAVLFPVLIYATATLIFLLTFIYDSILVLQDMNSLEASLKSSEQDFYYTYQEIIEEHPYISSREIDIKLQDKKGKKVITLSCEWIFPLADFISKPIAMTREIIIDNPIKIMRMIKGIREDSKKNDQDENY